MPGPVRKGILNDCYFPMKFISKGEKASRFIIILNRKVGQNHQVGAVEVKPKWKQKFLGMVSDQKWRVDNDIYMWVIYWEKHKIKLEPLTFKQGIRNLLISKQKSSKPLVKPHGLNRREVPWIIHPQLPPVKTARTEDVRGRGRPESARRSLFRLLASK